MGDALARMGSRGLGRLPVVSREDPYQLVGLLWREGISQAYTLALMRREEIQQRAQQFQNHHQAEAEFVQIPLSAEDDVIGKTVAEFAPSMPKHCVLVSIQRDGHVIIPHGDTVFQPGDQLTAFVHNQDAKQLFQSLHSPPKD